MPIPASHRHSKIGDCEIKTFKANDEIHLVFIDQNRIEHKKSFKETEFDEFFDALADLVVLAKISNSIKTKNNESKI
jgi:hypothetical protein